MFRSVIGVLEVISVGQRDHGHHWGCVLEWVRANQRQMAWIRIWALSLLAGWLHKRLLLPQFPLMQNLWITVVLAPRFVARIKQGVYVKLLGKCFLCKSSLKPKNMNQRALNQKVPEAPIWEWELKKPSDKMPWSEIKWDMFWHLMTS